MLISSRQASRILDEQTVLSVAQRQGRDHETLLDACPGGVFVVRLARGEEPPAEESWSTRADALSRQPYLGFSSWLHVRALLDLHGRLPAVFTVCGYPVLAAGLVSFRHAADQVVELGLERPGPWADLLEDRRLVTSPGPRWLVLGAQPYLGRAARARERGEQVGAARSTTWSRWA